METKQETGNDKKETQTLQKMNSLRKKVEITVLLIEKPQWILSNLHLKIIFSDHRCIKILTITSQFKIMAIKANIKSC